MDLRRLLSISSWIKDECIDCITSSIKDECVDCITFHEHCPPRCADYCPQYCLPPPPLPPPPPTASRSSYHHISIILIVVCILATAFLFLTYYTIFKRYCIRRFFAAPRSAPPQIHTVHHDVHDENDDPIHYIWYLSTPGLDESVINSITVCKYKKGDGLIDGTECSVCLTEFEEDEDLRLLPKCNHAFHLPCIDRWLRSHVSCPLCRANIVSNPVSAEISGSSVVADETLAGNSQGNIGSVSDRSDGFVSVQSVDGVELGGRQDERRDLDLESAKIGPLPILDSGFRVQSDLSQNHRLGENGVEMITEDGIQPVRRSVSMDSSAAAMISLSLAHLVPSDSEGSSSAVVVKSSGPKRIVPKHGRNPSFFKLMASCSKGPFLQKAPVPMKRSFSAGKFLLSRYGRSRNSVLPL